MGNLKDGIQDATQLNTKTVEQINAEIEALKSLLPKKEVKPTPEYILERRGFTAKVRNELFNFGAVQRAANKEVKTGGIDGFLKLLSEKQQEKFVGSRLSMAIKSKKLLLKVANKGVDVLSLTPNQYFNLVASFCTLTENEFNKRRGQSK